MDETSNQCNSGLTKDQKKFTWFLEYKHCSCTFVGETKDVLPQYCPRHGHTVKFKIRIPVPNDCEMGYVET